MSPREEPREREIGKGLKIGISLWIFTGLFGILITSGSTNPGSFYIGIILLSLNLVIMMIFLFWWIATKTDEFIGRKLD